MYNSKKRFTLIELIVVITIISILSTIVLPNISNMTSMATAASVNGNVASIQLALDMYSFDNNMEKATKNNPTIGYPVQIDFNKLYPKYLRNKCSDIKENYWLDYNGQVIGSTIKPPKVNESSDMFTISWDNRVGAKSYNVYSRIDNKLILLKENVTSPFASETALDMYVSAVDKHGFETPSVNSLYDPDSDIKVCNGSGENNISSLKVGSRIVMGNYNADSLQWVVLKKDANGYLLFNVNTLGYFDRMSFNTKDINNTNWSDSSLREFLNGDFYENAFTEKEKSIIKEHNYQYFVEEKYALQGSELLENYVDLDLNYRDNRHIAYSNYSMDKISLPSSLDLIDTNLIKYLYPIMTYEDDQHVWTRDSSAENNINTFMITGIFNHIMGDYLYIDETSVGIVKPVMYISADAKPSSGTGSLSDPFFFGEKDWFVPDEETVIKTYPNIEIKQDMFIPYDDLFSMNWPTKLITLKLEVPEEYLYERLYISMTFDKPYDGGINMVTNHNDILMIANEDSSLHWFDMSDKPFYLPNVSRRGEFIGHIPSIDRLENLSDLEIYIIPTNHGETENGFTIKDIKLIKLSVDRPED